MHSFAWWPTAVVVAVATYTDLRFGRIPNWLVLPFLVAGMVVSGWLLGWPGLGRSCEGMAMGAAIYGFLFWIGGMGAGDVKLCAAIGAWIGPSQLLIALVVTGLAGGVMVLAWAAWGGFLGELFGGVGDLLFGWKKRGMRLDPALRLDNPARRRMPYAPAIAIGTILSFLGR